MARARYFVLSVEGKWMIRLGGRNHGPYRTKKKAIFAAIDAAHQAGGGAQVFVQEEGDQFRTEWSEGKDPYPPLHILGTRQPA